MRGRFPRAPGTFTEEALLSEADLAGAELVSRTALPEVISAVEAGDADLGIVPIENSIEGSITITLDTLAFESDLLIQREVVRPVSLNLIARPGTKLADITNGRLAPVRERAVPPVAPPQLPGAALEAAQLDREAPSSGSRGRVRRGSRRSATHLAAELNRLAVIAEEIEDHPENATRFVILGHGIPPPHRARQDEHRLLPAGGPAGLADQHSPGVRGPRDQPVTKLESRPTKAASATTAS